MDSSNVMGGEATPRSGNPASQAAASAQLPGCQFLFGFKTLHDAYPDVVGDCINNQETIAGGNAAQQTTKGTLVWRKSDNVAVFTDGYRSWLTGPLGIQQRLNSERFAWENSGEGLLTGQSVWSGFRSGWVGYDVSYPQCASGGPPPGGFGIAGLNGGRPFTLNPCGTTQFSWVKQGVTPGVYLNLAYSERDLGQVSPDCEIAAPFWLDGTWRDAWALGCSEAEYSVAHQIGRPAVWWLDVESANAWSPDNHLNQQVIQGAVTYLKRALGAQVGIYSTRSFWIEITGGNSWTPDGMDATWLAVIARSPAEAALSCGQTFTTVPVKLVQYDAGAYDVDLVC